MCLGAGFVFPPDKDSDIIAGRGRSARRCDLPGRTCWTIRWSAGSTQIAAVQRARPDLRVIPPFFWDASGRATIHGFITSALKLYGEDVFVRVYDDPSPSLRCTTGSPTSISRSSNISPGWATCPSRRCISASVRARCCGRRTTSGSSSPTPAGSAGSSGRCASIRAAVPITCWRPSRDREPGRPGHRVEHLRAAIRARFGGDFGSISRLRSSCCWRGRAPGCVAWLERTLAENAGGPLHVGFHLEPGYSVENCLAIHEELRLRELTEARPELLRWRHGTTGGLRRELAHIKPEVCTPVGPRRRALFICRPNKEVIALPCQRHAALSPATVISVRSAGLTGLLRDARHVENP